MTTEQNFLARKKMRIPLWVKLLYSAFLALMIPVYFHFYGPTNFLYFCDVALLLTLVGMWTGNALLISLPCVGILIPQFFWALDFLVQLCGGRLTGMTGYMFNQKTAWYLRGLSLFHGWLPFLLVYLVWKTGYDKRALPGWTFIFIVLCCISYFLLPPAGAVLSNELIPRNVNYVFNLLSDDVVQPWMPQSVYLVVWIAALSCLAFVPTHYFLKKFCPEARP